MARSLVTNACRSASGRTRREMRGEPLEMTDGEVELAAIVLGHRRNREALLAMVAQ